MSDRPETGAMKFGDDWTGIFIRGDSAPYYAITLKTFLENTPQDAENVLGHIMLKGLAELLFSCEEGKDPNVQTLHAWDQCRTTKK
jgi:hypothetical protein